MNSPEVRGSSGLGSAGFQPVPTGILPDGIFNKLFGKMPNSTSWKLALPSQSMTNT